MEKTPSDKRLLVAGSAPKELLKPVEEWGPGEERLFDKWVELLYDKMRAAIESPSLGHKSGNQTDGR